MISTEMQGLGVRGVMLLLLLFGVIGVVVVTGVILLLLLIIECEIVKFQIWVYIMIYNDI